MTHFLENVLTFLFQYDIYISAFAKFRIKGKSRPLA